MHASLDRTPEILPVLKEAGVVDSGGAGLLYIMEGFNRVLNGEEVSEVNVGGAKPSTATSFTFDADSVMTYGYCTELLLQLQNAKTDVDSFDIEALKSFLSSVGDSVVAFKTESIVKLHVHTLTPEKVLEHCRKYGEFLTVKIENMSLQHTQTLQNDADEAKENTVKAEKPDVPKKKYAMVAVCNGDGVIQLYSDLGVDAVIRGGQTHNPSTSDFIEAFEGINAEHIFVFPNNSNIFMAAQQAADLYSDAEIHVLPSKSVGIGYVAVSSANLFNEDVNAVIEEMNAAMARVTAGYISPSIRDADMNGVHIHSGDTIGIIDKEIVVSEENRMDAVKNLSSLLLDLPEKFMLTVFCGEDALESEQSELTEYLAKEYPDAEVYFIDGGQEIYPYIFVAE